ncbi:20502_t:CDS:1, partial [Racocetra persica]
EYSIRSTIKPGTSNLLNDKDGGTYGDIDDDNDSDVVRDQEENHLTDLESSDGSISIQTLRERALKTRHKNLAGSPIINRNADELATMYKTNDRT